MDNAQQICEQVRQALVDNTQLQVRGAASKPWLQATASGSILSLGQHRGVVAYDPTELVVTVRAGTALAELDQVLLERGQMLAAECPDFGGSSTIGGALATGWSGSRQAYAGPLRDFVLGAQMVNGLGEQLSFGGQVMKNVAGFDVSRLLSGSQGRLGVILELSLKVLPLPELEITLLFDYETLQQSRQFARRLLQQGEPLSGASYQAGQLRLRFSGRAVTLARIQAELGGQQVDNDYWRELRRLQLPLFDAVSRDSAAQALYDWNGSLCWSRSASGVICRQVDDHPAVDLSQGPESPSALRTAGAGRSALAALRQKLALAFDPQAVFQPAPAHAA